MENSHLPSKLFFSLNTKLWNLADANLHTEDGDNIAIHKMELTQKSQYFKRLFCGSMGKDRSNFLIPGISGEVLRNVLSYIYADDVDITDENVCDILAAADYLLLDNLVEHIKKTYVRNSLSINNCLPIFVTALKINRYDISSASYRYIQTQFEDVVGIDDSEIGELPLESLKQLLVDKNLRVRDENAVWVAIAKWVQADLIHRQSLVPNLLMYMTVSGVDEQLAKKMLEHDIVRCNPFCEHINKLKHWSFIDYSLIFARLFGYSNIKIFRYYIQQQFERILPFNYRMPDNFNIIMRSETRVLSGKGSSTIYATYDENIDVWRKILEIELWPKFVICIGDSIYTFSGSIHVAPSVGGRRFNLIEKRWKPMPEFRVAYDGTMFGAFGYRVLEISGLIYVIGGWPSGGVVDVYNPDTNLWSKVSPMLEVCPIMAVTLGNIIYAVGCTPVPENSRMVAQAYDSETNVWTVLPPPSVHRDEFELVVYREKLLVLGGANLTDYLKSVEMFDPARGEWTAFEDLPHTFYTPKAIVLKHELFVYEANNRSYLETNPAVIWDEEKKYWKSLEESSFINTLKKYSVFFHDTRDCMNAIVRENKDPTTEFVKSPFN